MGCFLAFMLILRLIVERISNFWILFNEILLACVVAYLIYIGRRGLRFAKGRPLRRARFGWGRILFGVLFIFGSLNAQFQLVPTQPILKHLEPSNPTQAGAMVFTETVFQVGCLMLIASGIWRGFRPLDLCVRFP